MLELLERMAEDANGRIGAQGLSPEEESAAESLEDERLAKWVDDHPFYGYHITVKGYDRLAKTRK